MEHLTKRIASNFVWVLVGEAIGKGIFFVTTIILARNLGVEKFGLFSLAQSITFYLWLGASLGTDMYGIREVARHKEKPELVVSPLFSMRLFAGVSVFVLYAVIVLTFFKGTELPEKLVFIGCGLYLPASSFYTDWVFRGLEKFRYIAFGSLVGSGLFLISVLLLARGQANATIAAFSWSISFFAGGAVLLVVLVRKINIRVRLEVDSRMWWSHLKESIHFAGTGALWTLYRFLPIIVLGVLYTERDIGIFSAAYRTITTMCGAGLVVSTALFPVISELYLKDRHQFRRADRRFLLVMLAVGMPLGLLGFLLAKPLVLLLFGGQYSQSVPVFSILVWFVPLSLVRSKYSASIRATEYQRWQSIPALVAIITFVVLVALSRPGLVPLAAANLVAEASAVACFVVLARFTYDKPDRPVSRRLVET